MSRLLIETWVLVRTILRPLRGVALRSQVQAVTFWNAAQAKRNTIAIRKRPFIVSSLCVALLALTTFTAIPYDRVSAQSIRVPYTNAGEKGGWTAEGRWHLSSDRSASGDAWYFGFDNGPGAADNSYHSGQREYGALRSPPVDLTNTPSAILQFWHFWDGEGCPRETPTVLISVQGTMQGAAFSICPSSGGPTTTTIDLGQFLGQLIEIAFLWDTIDETDNRHEGWYVDDISIQPMPAPTGFPDLIPTSLDWRPSALYQGNRAQLRSFVLNQGTIASGPFDVEFAVGDWFGVTRVSGLPAGTSVLVESPAFLPAVGTWVATVQVDAETEILEEDEENNLLDSGADEGVFEVQPVTFPSFDQPDLRPLSITAALSNAEPGQTTSFNLGIANDGPDWARATQVLLSIDGLELPIVQSHEIPPGEQVVLSTEPWLITEGDHRLVLKVDPNRQIAETSETNNELPRTMEFRFPPPPSANWLDLATRIEAANATSPTQLAVFAKACNVGLFAIDDAYLDFEAEKANPEGTVSKHVMRIVTGRMLANEKCHEYRLTLDTGRLPFDLVLRGFPLGFDDRLSNNVARLHCDEEGRCIP